mgnify:FL=1
MTGVQTCALPIFNGVTAGLTALGTQMSGCCCDTQRQMERGFCDINYNAATNARDIIQTAHNDTDRIIARLDQMENTRQQEKIAALQNENQALKFAASQEAQNNYLVNALRFSGCGCNTCGC